MSAVRKNDSTHVPTPDERRQAGESSRLLAACLRKGGQDHVRVVAGDTDVTVPVAAVHMLVDILKVMAQGQGVNIVPSHALLTTQEAADFLNVSRPYLVGMLEAGKLPFQKVGTHRRVLFEDLLRFDQALRASAAQAATELSRLAQETGEYD